MEGFPEPPTKERFCRCLKKLAKNKHDIWLLWKSVLEKTNHDHDSITSNVIQEVWNDLFAQGKVTGTEDTATPIPEESVTKRDEDNDKSPIEPAHDAQNVQEPKEICSQTPHSDLSSDDSIYDKLEDVGASHAIIESIIPNYEKKIAARPKKRKAETPQSSQSAMYRPSSVLPREQHPPSMLPFPSYGSSPSTHAPPPHHAPSHELPSASQTHFNQHSYPLPNWKYMNPKEPLNHPHLNMEELSKFTKTMISLQRRGYILQPFSNNFGKWMDEPLLYWRLYNAREPMLSLSLTQEAGPSFTSTPVAPYHFPPASPHNLEHHQAWNPPMYIPPPMPHPSHPSHPIPSMYPYPPHNVMYDPSSSHYRMSRQTPSSSSSKILLVFSLHFRFYPFSVSSSYDYFT